MIFFIHGGIMDNKIILNENSESIKYLSKKDRHLKILFNLIGEISYTLYNDSYKFLVNTIIGQMLSNKVADIISNRLLDLCNGDINPKTIIKLSYSELRNIGISNSKINYIMNLTTAVLNKEINFESFSTKNNIEIEKELQKIKGIGKWSSKMYLIFVLDRNDVLPYEDMAFIQGYSWLYNTTKVDKKSIMTKCKKWGNYSSIAARYLYKALDLGYTKIKFSEYKKSDI
jgi:DNA-3-methyladenine glycosylase II